ncbi:MAG TPA: hypothetical protein VIL36_04790, partial [Acidimicrobiales bacterium]
MAMADGGVGLVAAGFFEEWQDMALELWIGTGAVALVWFALLGLCMAITEPKKVDPGPATLDLPGQEPPAVVNLIANDWRLEEESMPATLLDLAARGHLVIEQIGDDTYVRVPKHKTTKAANDRLTRYEEMIHTHVGHLARQGSDGMVPAAALTTGPESQAKGWWKRYRKAVSEDAHQRGLARKRWSATVHSMLVGTALAVALVAGLAVSATPENENSTSRKDDNPIGAGIGMAVVAWGGLIALVEY